MKIIHVFKTLVTYLFLCSFLHHFLFTSETNTTFNWACENKCYTSINTPSIISTSFNFCFHCTTKVCANITSGGREFTSLAFGFHCSGKGGHTIQVLYQEDM